MIQFYGVKDVYSESGVDLTLLSWNLRLPIENRLASNASMLRFCRQFDKSPHGANAPKSTRSSDMPLDVEGFLKCLHEQRVDFVLVGGLAMIAQGSAYITKDIDICYSRTPENLAALVTAMAPLHPYLRGAPPGLPFRFDVPTLEAGLNFTLTTDLADIDLLGEISGIGGYAQARLQSEEKIIYGLQVFALSIDGLITSKKAAARTKDQLHILELVELKKLRDTSGSS